MSCGVAAGGCLQNNTGGGFEPRGASGVRMSAGIGIDEQERSYLYVVGEGGVWWLYDGCMVALCVYI